MAVLAEMQTIPLIRTYGHRSTSIAAVAPRFWHTAEKRTILLGRSAKRPADSNLKGDTLVFSG